MFIKFILFVTNEMHFSALIICPQVYFVSNSTVRLLSPYQESFPVLLNVNQSLGCYALLNAKITHESTTKLQITPCLPRLIMESSHRYLLHNDL